MTEADFLPQLANGEDSLICLQKYCFTAAGSVLQQHIQQGI